VVGTLVLVPPVAAVLLREVFPIEVLLLLAPPPQAVTSRPAAAITAMADSREQLRSMRTSPARLEVGRV